MRIRLWAAVMAALVVTACGGSSGTTPVEPPPVTPDSFLISLIPDCGDSTLEFPGGSRLCSAEATWNTGSKVSVTFSASWSATGSAVSVESGKVTPMAPGEATVTVAYGGKTASVKLVVKKKDTFTWAELPPLSEAGRQIIEAWNIGTARRVTRVTDTVIKVWAQPGIDPEDLRLAGQFWSGYIKSLRFEIVPDSASAHTVVYLDPTIVPPVAAYGGPLKVSGGSIQKGSIRVSPVAIAGMSAQANRVHLFAHELGHVLGISGHPSGCHLMSYGCTKTELDSTMSEVYTWLYNAEAGIKIAP